MKMKKEYMTLGELLARVGSTVGIEKKPTPKFLRENDEAVDVYEAEDYRIMVYKSGFAVAMSGRHTAVIQVDECGAYAYDFDNSWLNGQEDATPHQFNADYFLDLQWPIRLVMAADDELEKNQNKQEDGWISKHPEIPDDKNWMLGGYSSFEDSLLNRMEREEMLKTMTEKQRQVFLLYYKYGYTQEEIGKRIGISRDSVKNRLEGALNKLRRFYQ